MQFLTKLGVGLALAVVVIGCTVRTGEDAKKDKLDELMEPEPAVAALYGDLATATPDKIRGVWRVARTDDEGEFRVRFDDGHLVNALRCGKYTTGNERSVTITDADEKKGTIVLETTASMSLTSESGSCGATFAADSWSFVIEGTKATLTSTANGSKKMQLEKVGD